MAECTGESIGDIGDIVNNNNNHGSYVVAIIVTTIIIAYCRVVIVE